jgi:hypothetical protein
MTPLQDKKNDEGDEKPIAFMRKVLRDLEMNYTIIEKQTYAPVKSLKHFRTYVGYNKIKAFVANPTPKHVLSQHDCLGSRGKWMSQIQKYDLEINPSKIIKGQGLAKMLTEGNQEAIEVGEKEQVNVVISETENDKWYSDIIYYLKNLTCLEHVVDHKRRALRLKSMKYYLTQGLGWRNLDGVILRCVNKEEENKLISELHS